MDLYRSIAEHRVDPTDFVEPNNSSGRSSGCSAALQRCWQTMTNIAFSGRHKISNEDSSKPILIPFQTCNRYINNDPRGKIYRDYRLQRKPESLKAFVELFKNLERDKQEEIKEYRSIWITDQAFICQRPKPGYQLSRFIWTLFLENRFGVTFLTIYTTGTDGDTMNPVLEFLAELHDDFFQKIQLRYCARPDDTNWTCPLPPDVLSKLLAHATNRKTVFHEIIFTAEQCRALALAGTRTNLTFDFCGFIDEGVAFREAFASRVDENTGPAMLTFNRHAALNDENLCSFLALSHLQSLKLDSINIDTEDACRALADAKIDDLYLDHCELIDKGAVFIAALAEERGPLGFHIECGLDTFEEQLPLFVNALGGNTRLERLSIDGITQGDGSFRALTTSLHENKGLTQLKITGLRVNDSTWQELLDAFSNHPSLHTVHFDDFFSTCKYVDKLKAAKAASKMLQVNHRIEEFFAAPLDYTDSWEKLVIPKLEFNGFHTHFSEIRRITVLSLRAAVLAQILARMNHNVSIVWQLLMQNSDTVCSYCGQVVKPV